jgi:SH3-like domain-containing protein
VPRAIRSILTCIALVAVLDTAAVAQRKTPYWASISASEARMRTGPGRQFPASWLYQRAGLPVVVLQTYPNWRKVRDPDGETGWIQANLLSDDRTALIKGDVRPLRDKPNMSANVIWRAEPGVVGKITECARGWCKFDARGRMGYVETAHIWGADVPEVRP